MSAKLRRHYKAKARRERQLRSKPPGVKERFIAGCFFFGILGAVVLLTALTWSCLHREP